jgi:hypothetical protein
LYRLLKASTITPLETIRPTPDAPRRKPWINRLDLSHLS